MSLSVVMATYRGARWLPAQLESLAAQTRRPDEVVVSDDASDDDTVEVIMAFARRAPFPVRLLVGPGTGLADNFRHALAASSGTLVAWADQDDEWSPRKLARCVAALEEHDADLVHHAATVVDGDGRSLGFRHPDVRRTTVHDRLAGDPWLVPSGFASVFRRSLLDGLDDAAWAARPVSHQTGRAVNHDHVVSLLAFARGRRCELADDLARYRQHGANVAGAPTVRGSAAWVGALAVGSAQFADRAAAARGYGAWLADPAPGAWGDPAGPAADWAVPAGRYFERVARRWERRAETYRALADRAMPARVVGGLGALARRASGSGDYASRASGGMGAAALAKDALVTVVGAR